MSNVNEIKWNMDLTAFFTSADEAKSYCSDRSAWDEEEGQEFWYVSCELRRSYTTIMGRARKCVARAVWLGRPDLIEGFAQALEEGRAATRALRDHHRELFR